MGVYNKMKKSIRILTHYSNCGYVVADWEVSVATMHQTPAHSQHPPTRETRV